MLKCLNVKMTKRGFTLMEIMVSVTASFLIIGAIIGLFISINQSQKRILSTYELVNQTGYAIEYMSRALRTGEKESGQGCLASSGLNYEIPVIYQIGGNENLGTGLKFINHLENNDCQEFFLDGSQLKYRKGIGTVNEQILALTSNDLQIIDFKFKLSGKDHEDNIQPRITMLFVIQAGEEGAKINIQTTVSQRNIDTYQIY
ncbi:hypothetical protein KAT95_02695 [Candidatus Parcubacteria bacterium]|nr:hypothetical protein [Candidatus Parcubacteria bacterium]